MEAIKRKQTMRIIGACALIILLSPILVFLGRRYGLSIWDNLHFVNFVVAWIPAFLSILVAFIPDKELEVRMRIWWRTSVILGGVFYSVFLWHQQTLTDLATTASQNQAINAAVTRANAHSDEKFRTVTNEVSGVQKQVQAVGKQLNVQGVEYAKDLASATGNIDKAINTVGKPVPPPPAILTFSLWSPAATPTHPVLIQTVKPGKDGSFPVSFTVTNAGTTTAKSIDIWIQVCDVCSFAKGPAGFELPNGTDPHVRHRRIGDLNPGVSFEKMTAFVKAPLLPPRFAVAFRYSCEDCGGKTSANQIAYLTISNTF